MEHKQTPAIIKILIGVLKANAIVLVICVFVVVCVPVCDVFATLLQVVASVQFAFFSVVLIVSILNHVVTEVRTFCLVLLAWLCKFV